MSPGELVIGGFEGTSLPPAFERALREQRRGGAILFKHNLVGDPDQAWALARQVHDAMPSPILAIDQEGGRVARLGPPFLRIPPMKTVAAWADEELAEQIAYAVGRELAAVGFTMNFAPVLDVNTCPGNPIIGDRAFAADASTCARFGLRWISGLQKAGLLATAKHFPGHGDTSKDSHLELPYVEQPLERLHAVELMPFRAAARSGVAATMTAHVVYRALDANRPATLSSTICTRLREQIDLGGVLISDDLGMQAIARRWPPGEAAVEAVAAGCDAVLVCHGQEEQEAAVAALVAEAQVSDAFRERCAQAVERVRHARRLATARMVDRADLADVIGGAEARSLCAEMARRSE